MFYPTTGAHGLAENPFNALIIPRPIGWISSQDREGNVNLAPYSFFNAVAYEPPQVLFSATGKHAHENALKDSVRNILETGEFVHNLARWALRDAVNASSAAAPHGVDEFELAGLGKLPSKLVSPPRIAESPAHLECKLVKTIDLPTGRATGGPDAVTTLVVGQVVGIHIDDDVLTDGKVDVKKLDPIARLGYRDYARIIETFTMTRPSWP